MRKIHILSLTLFAVFAYSVIVVASAFADEWLNGSNAITGTTTLHVESLLGTLLLEDMGPAVQVLAEGTFLGWVGANGTGQIEEFIVENAVFDPGGQGACSAPLVVSPVNQPYDTLLSLEGTMFWNNIKKHPGVVGEPGWLVECQTILGKVDDTCTTGAGRALIENGTGGEVNGEFDETVEANCVGAPGATKGLITNEGGPVGIFLLNGNALTVN